MKSNRSPIQGVALALALLLAALGASCSKSGPADHGHQQPPGSLGSTGEVWSRINALHAALVSSVERKMLADVHDGSGSLAAALKALPAASKDLPAEKLSRVTSTVNDLVKALDAAHDAADGGDQAATERQLKAVAALVKQLAEQYPAAESAAASKVK